MGRAAADDGSLIIVDAPHTQKVESAQSLFFAGIERFIGLSTVPIQYLAYCADCAQITHFTMHAQSAYPAAPAILSL
jgi:hypothetical protein